MHDQNAFITLTYNNHSLPSNNSLKKSDFQKFVKRLRRHIEPKKIRYYYCGEYTDDDRRPHFHALIFGLDFNDKYEIYNEGKEKLYRSPTLEKLWKLGFSSTGTVTFQSAAYIAGYCLKKINGKKAEQYYKHVTKHGELVDLEPEFAMGSRNPGIGAKWIEKYMKDAYPSDEIIINGRPQKPPPYYDKLYERTTEIGMEIIKAKRRAMANPKDNTQERLKVRETVLKAKLNQNKRKLK